MNTEQTEQQAIEEAPDESREKVPLDWDIDAIMQGGVKKGELTVLRGKNMQPTYSDEQITQLLQAEGHDAEFIAGYLSGWHKKPFNKA